MHTLYEKIFCSRKISHIKGITSSKRMKAWTLIPLKKGIYSLKVSKKKYLLIPSTTKDFRQQCTEEEDYRHTGAKRTQEKGCLQRSGDTLNQKKGNKLVRNSVGASIGGMNSYFLPPNIVNLGGRP
jgi:hypothetical protein